MYQRKKPRHLPKTIYRIVSECNHLIVIIMDKITDHANIIYKEYQAVPRQFRIEHFADVRKSPLSLKEFNSQIIFSGMDDSQRVKGLCGATCIWFEEISGIKMN